MSTSTRTPRGIDLRGLPIAVKLTAGLVLVLLISGFVTDRLVRQVVGNSQEQLVLAELETLSRSQAFRMVDALGEEVVALNRLGADPVLQDKLRIFMNLEITATTPYLLVDAIASQQLTDFRRTHDEFNSVVLLDAAGHVRGIDPYPAESAAFEPDKWIWFITAYNSGTGSSYITNPAQDYLTGLTGVHISLPVYDNQEPDRVIGVVYGIWNMSNIRDITEVGAEREGIILEPDGTVLISPAEPQGVSYPSALTQRFNEAPSGAWVYADETGQEWLYGYATLRALELGEASVAALNWIVVTRQPVSALQASTSLLASRVLIAIGVSALLVTVVVLLLTTSLLGPLRRLTSAAAQIEGGDLAAPIPTLPADEVGRLAETMRGLVARLLQRLGELRAAVQVSHAAVLTLDVTQMLGDLARSLTTQFNYPDVRIYLTDPEGRRAIIQAASGGEGERLLRSGYRLTVDETTLIGRAILLGEPQIGAQRERLREAGLTTGRSELALPLQSSGRALGAMHLLARRLGEFEPEEVDILRLIADQISASIANARLFEQSRANLAEIGALNRRLTRQAWEEYVSASGAIRHTLDPDQNWPSPPEALLRSDEARAEIYADPDGRSVLAVPLILRGETVGTLSVTRPSSERWSQDEIALLESVAARMGVIADGIRLVDESSRRARREQQVNEVSANLLQRATDVETVLRTALRELGGTLGSDRIALRLGSAPDIERQTSTGSTDGRGVSDGSPSGDDSGDGNTRRPNGQEG
jgi:GAF domain-containing protein